MRPHGTATMAMAGALSGVAPAEPWNRASPKEKIPPSAATSHYPLPVGVGAIPTIGLLSRMLPVEPKNRASPKEKIPPSDATSQ